MSVRKCFILKCRTVSLITSVRLNKMIQIKILTIFNFDRIVEIAIVIRIRETDLSINSFSRNQGVLSVHPLPIVPQCRSGTGFWGIFIPAGSIIRYHPGPCQSGLCQSFTKKKQSLEQACEFLIHYFFLELVANYERRL